MPQDRWQRVFAQRERLLRLARGRIPDEAEDIVQEAMLRCATFPDLDDERLGELLTSVTVRLCVDEHRRQSRAERLQRRLPLDRGEEPGPDEQVCARAEAEWAAEIFRTLPAMQQVVIADRAAGLSFDEISRRHRVSYKSAESSASRARAFVRRALAATLAALGLARRPIVIAPSAVTAVAYVTLALGTGNGSLSSTYDTRPARPSAQRDLRTGDWTSPTFRGTRAAIAGQAIAAPSDRSHALPSPSAVPAPSRSPYVSVGESGVGPDERHEDYTTAERLEHCVRYGVAVRPTVRCRYPDDPGPGLNGGDQR